MDHRSCRGGCLPDRHLHLAALLQEVPRSEDGRDAQVGNKIWPEPGTVIQRRSRLHSAACGHSRSGHQGARSDFMTSGAIREVSRPPTGLEIVSDRIFRQLSLAGAAFTLVLVVWIVVSIARVAAPAVHT